MKGRLGCIANRHNKTASVFETFWEVELGDATYYDAANGHLDVNEARKSV